jgi:hypothetical protein
LLVAIDLLIIIVLLVAIGIAGVRIYGSIIGRCLIGLIVSGCGTIVVRISGRCGRQENSAKESNSATNKLLFILVDFIIEWLKISIKTQYQNIVPCKGWKRGLLFFNRTSAINVNTCTRMTRTYR